MKKIFFCIMILSNISIAADNTYVRLILKNSYSEAEKAPCNGVQKKVFCEAANIVIPGTELLGDVTNDLNIKINQVVNLKNTKNAEYSVLYQKSSETAAYKDGSYNKLKSIIDERYDHFYLAQKNCIAKSDLERKINEIANEYFKQLTLKR